MNQFSWKTKTIFHLCIISYHIISYRPVASIKWLGGLSEWPTLTPRPPASVPRLKHTSWYMYDHYICLQYLLFLSLIFRLCWLWRNREIVWDIVRGKLAKQFLSGCTLIWIVSSTTPGSVSLVHGVIPTIKVFPAYFRLVWISFSAAVAKTL